MPLSLLVAHSSWQSLQTAETRSVRCHLLGWKRHGVYSDLTRYQRRLEPKLSLGLNLNLYPSPPVSFFGSCGHHISILSSELSILRCVLVKIATGSALAHQVQPVYVIRKMAPPIVQNMYKTMSFFKITETFMGFSSTCFSKIHQVRYIKPYKS